MRVVATSLLLLCLPLTASAQAALSCGPAGRGRPAPDRTRCLCVAPRFVEQVTDGVHRCAPPRREAAARRSTCPAGTVSIQGGEFWMGSPEGAGFEDERPRRRVRLSPYCIDRTEVTVAAYRACVDAGACSAANTDSYISEGATTESDRAQRRLLNDFCNWNRSNASAHPINCVAWAQADAYCRFRGGRLPTEAEWEFAARGSDERLYPWGAAAPDELRLNAAGAEFERYVRAHGVTNSMVEGHVYPADDGWVGTAPVGSFPRGASPFGVVDMAGNVAEWVSDWYADAYPGAPAPAVNPRGPEVGTHRVGRGSSWINVNRALLDAAHRIGWLRPEATLSFVGFRCARARP